MPSPLRIQRIMTLRCISIAGTLRRGDEPAGDRGLHQASTRYALPLFSESGEPWGSIRYSVMTFRTGSYVAAQRQSKYVICTLYFDSIVYLSSLFFYTVPPRNPSMLYLFIATNKYPQPLIISPWNSKTPQRRIWCLFLNYGSSC